MPDLAGSLADCEAVLGKLDPESVVALSERANVYQQQGEWEKSLADLDAVIKLSPKSAIALNNRGFAYFQHGDLERAIVDFTAALRWNPNTPKH